MRDAEVTPARPLLLTVREAAALLRLGRSTVYELIADGELETVHVGRCARVPLAAVESFVERLRAPHQRAAS